MLQVGTYIGERLIYAPSIGFCILVAELLANLAGDALPQILLLWYSVGGNSAPSPACSLSASRIIHSMTFWKGESTTLICLCPPVTACPL